MFSNQCNAFNKEFASKASAQFPVILQCHKVDVSILRRQNTLCCHAQETTLKLLQIELPQFSSLLKLM